jgi:DtxR family Mn-dependent transcriptional regulator
VGRQQVEDALKYLFNLQQEGRPASIDALSGALHLSERTAFDLVSRLQTQGLVEQSQRDLVLSPAGQRWALQIVRAHRLWERYLADEARMPLEQIHREAHQREHGMTAEEVNRLDAELGHPARDPHGDPIPNAAGTGRDLQSSSSLAGLQAGARGQIAHLEDEPPMAYAQLLAEGLFIGQPVTILANTPEGVILDDGEEHHTLAQAIAANVFVQLQEQPRQPNRAVIPLSDLKSKTRAEVVEIDERCQGFTRRRFLDLGLTPGTPIYPELENAFKEPRAYRVRGTLIALRNHQANQIWVQPIPENKHG